MPQYVLKLNISIFSQKINSVNDRYSLYCEYLGKVYKGNNCLKSLALEGKEEKKLFYFTYEKWPNLL